MTEAQDQSQSWAYVSRGQLSSSTCYSCFCCCCSYCSFFYSFSYTLACPTWSHIFLLGKQLASRGLLGSLSIENFDYVSCQLGKQPALLQFLQFLPLRFSMLVLVMHLPLGYNNWLLEVCQVQCLKKILIVSHVSQENNQLCLSILVNQYPMISLTLFILMFGGLPLSLVLVDLDILLSLLMITLAIAGFLI